MKLLSTLFLATATLAVFCQPLPQQLDPNGSGPQKYRAPAVFKNSLYFFGSEFGVTNSKFYLWSNNGTGPSEKVAEVPMNVSPVPVVESDTLGYFSGSGSLWATNGTAAGTREVKSGINNISSMVAHKGKVFFAADGGNGGRIYVSDGTPNGTFSLSETGIKPEALISFGDYVYFIANPWDFELWRTDGTPAGTVRVFDNFETSRFGPRIFRDHLYFYGNDAVSGKSGLFRMESNGNKTHLLPYGGASFYGTEEALYVSPDGFLRKSTDGVNFTDVGWYSFYTPSAIGNRVVFQNDESTYGSEPWVTDGTVPNTKLLKDVNPAGISFGYDYGFNEISSEILGYVYFIHKTPMPGTTGGFTHLPELFVTDGTPEGTQSVYKVDGSRFECKLLRQRGNDLFFVGARNSTAGEEKLYLINGFGTSVDENPMSRDQVAYPNPAGNQINVPGNGGEIFITDVTGAVVLRSGSQYGLTSVDISGLPSGMYVITRTGEDSVLRSSFIKQ